MCEDIVPGKHCGAQQAAVGIDGRHCQKDGHAYSQKGEELVEAYPVIKNEVAGCYGYIKEPDIVRYDKKLIEGYHVI